MRRTLGSLVLALFLLASVVLAFSFVPNLSGFTVLAGGETGNGGPTAGQETGNG